MLGRYPSLWRTEPVLTAAELRAAEHAAMTAGASESELMRRAGTAAADAIEAFAGRARTLVLAGPGNNGGDGYVLAGQLAARGWPVAVATATAPKTPAARQAAESWGGSVQPIAEAQPAPLLVDALFGTGLSRGLDAAVLDAARRLAADARIVAALDLPSGVDTDSGACLSEPLAADLTVAFAALKPAHLLHPAATRCGRVVVADIGLGKLRCELSRIGRPELPALAPDTNKYARGHVAVVAGRMPGAAWLAARAAQRGGGGYVTLVAEDAMPPSSIVRTALADVEARRIDALVLGPGLGRGRAARTRALRALGFGVPAVLDADLFSLFRGDAEALAGRGDVMTPHEGEFRRFFGDLPGSKLDRARVAAAKSGNIVVLKGPDTVVAAPDGRVAINAHASPRLATAGSGDVLSGLIAALMARGMPPFEAACGGVWLHGDAALRARGAIRAEDLVDLVRA